jgi:two-component system response regulator RegX3
VLVVDDDEAYRDALTLGLAREGFEVAVAADGREGLDRFVGFRPDLVLLDLVLPDVTGTELCQRMLQLATVPVIMVSARDAEVDVVLSLEQGAADYVTKPFRLRELVARIRAVLRRHRARPPGRPDQGPVISGGLVQLDPESRTVTVDGRTTDLSRREFDLLGVLVGRYGQVVTREQCIDALWGTADLFDTRTLDTHVKRLRHKIEADPTNPRHLVTVRGVGFRFQI